MSVVIPTYERAQVVGRAVRTALAQTMGDLEVIVVDDASSDNTAAVLAAIGDDRLRCLRHERNLGGGAARNTGIRASRGEFVAFLDSDDEWFPSKIEEQVAAFGRADARTGIVYCQMEVVTPQGPYLYRSSLKSGYVFRAQLLDDQLPPTSAIMARRECFARCGLFDESLPSRQDYDMWLRITRDYEVRPVARPLVRVHWSGTERIGGNPQRVIAGSEAVLAKVMALTAEESGRFRRRIVSSHCERLGRTVASLGYPELAAPYFARAFRACPGLHQLFYLAVAAGGRPIYSRVVRLRRGLRTLGVR